MGKDEFLKGGFTTPSLQKGGFAVSSLPKGNRGNFSPFLKGDQGGLHINEKGELEVETELGKVTFTKPVAFQEIEEKRVNVAVEYSVQKTEARSQNKEEKTSSSTPSWHPHFSAALVLIMVNQLPQTQRETSM